MFSILSRSLLLALLLLPCSAAAEVIHIVHQDDEISAGRSCEILEDKTGKLTIDDVIPRNDFVKAKSIIQNYGFTNSVYWVRLTVQNDSIESLSRFIEIGFPLLDSLKLYVFSLSQGKKKLKRIEITGRDFPFNSRIFHHRNFIFPVDIYSKEKIILFLRIKTDDAMIFPIKIWKASSLNQQIQKEQFLFGIYYGIILVMILYNLFIFISTGDRNYFRYILYISSFGMFQMSMNGLACMFFWTDNPWWTRHASPFLIGMSAMTAAHFTRNFLETKKNALFFDRILKGLLAVAVLFTAVSLFADYSITIIAGQLLPLCMILAVIPAAVICYKKGNRAARFYLIAWTIFFIGVILSAFRVMGIIGHNILTEHGLQIGSGIEMVLLSLALADRINIMKEEKDAAQMEVIRQQSEIVDHLNQSRKKLEDAHSRLSLSEKKYRLLVEGSGDIIFTLDKGWNFITANKSLEKLLRLDPKKIESVNFLDIIHSAGEGMDVEKSLVLEKLENFSEEKKPIQFRTQLISKLNKEPRDMLISLEYIKIKGRDEILGKASPILEDSLLKYFYSEKQEYYIGNMLTTAEDVTHRITRNLTKYMPQGKINLIRIALREIMINAIEHGNLGITFEDKSHAIEDDTYFNLLIERQSHPESKKKKIHIEYSVDDKGVVYSITDEGEGFNHRDFIKNSISNANDSLLLHGRGIFMTMSAFDEVKYNDKGNGVVLTKKFE